MNDILAVIILYHPDKGLDQRIATYIDYVSKLVVIDNSEPPITWVPELLSPWKHKIDFVVNSSNKGIGQPLNLAASVAVKEKFDWILTMDQDSIFIPGAFDELKSVAFDSPPHVGLISPFHQVPTAPKPKFSERTKKVKLTMTSGNLLRTSAYVDAGPFEEKLFIDSVDHEYYLRLRNKKYDIICANNAVLLHPLGESFHKKILGLDFNTTNHSALRRYYMTRNRLYVSFKYFFSDFWFFFREFKQIINSIFVVILLDTEKRKKLKMISRGVWDWMRGRYGKF